jgi:hypothetical protein
MLNNPGLQARVKLNPFTPGFSPDPTQDSEQNALHFHAHSTNTSNETTWTSYKKNKTYIAEHADGE